MSTTEATNGTCPDGYKNLFLNVCLKVETINPFSSFDINLSDFSFTDLICEVAVAALEKAADLLKKALKLPQKLFDAAKSLLSKPFDDAKKLVASALDMVTKIAKEVNDILKNALSGVQDLVNSAKSLLKDALSCPYLADSPIGKTISSILDALNTNIDPTSLLNSLKSMLQSQANKYINALEDTALSQLKKIQDLVNSMIKRLGIEDIVSAMKKIEQCIKAACKAYQEVSSFVDRVKDKNSDDLLNSIGGTWDEVTGKLSIDIVKDAAEETVVSDVKKMYKSYCQIGQSFTSPITIG